MSMTERSKDLSYWTSLPIPHPFMACFEGNYNEHAIKQNMNPQAIWAVADLLLLWVCSLPCVSFNPDRTFQPVLAPRPKAGISSHHVGDGRKRRRGTCDTVTLSLQMPRLLFFNRSVIWASSSRGGYYCFYFLPFLSPHLRGVWVWRESQCKLWTQK